MEINVWWGGKSMRDAKRCIMEPKTSHGQKAMMAFGGLQGAESIDATATLEGKKTWQRSTSGAQRRNAKAIRSDAAGKVTEKWQELSNDEYGRQVGPVACPSWRHWWQLRQFRHL